MTNITLPAYAKLNLTLDILRRREDGYHDLQMVMQTVDLHDDVAVALTGGEGIECLCGDLPGDGTNLAVRAAEAFFAETGTPRRGLFIEIDKQIPVQAGLGGGSADAAAVLRALRKLLRPELLGEELERSAALVGSDVPFCLRGGTALAEGRGERLTSLRAAPPFYAVLCKPDFGISTPELFSRVRIADIWNRPDTAGMLAALHRGDEEGVLSRVKNVFEAFLPPECMEVFTLKERMRALGAEAAAMTGSGPTVFGLFRDEDAADEACDALAEDYEETYFTQLA
jgi:4-diphosphocytidyl-2-C-methyl-D-erythritol kinase